MLRKSLLEAHQDFSTSNDGTSDRNNNNTALTPKSCLVVRPDTDIEELEWFSRLDENAQSSVEHIFVMGVDLSESLPKLKILETIFRTRKAKWRAVTLDRCGGPVETALTALLLHNNGAALENLTLNSLAISLPIAIALQNGLQRPGRGIQKISFCGCRWTTQGVAHCLRGLKRNDSVHTIRFNGGEFGDEASMALANSIGRCSRILRLELFSCNLSDRCAETLVLSLLQLPYLEHLDLGRNYCHAASLVAIGKLLESSTTLHTLNLALQESNDGREGIPIALSLLCPGLQMNKSLKSLYLRGNRLDDAACDGLIETLIGDNYLQNLMLTDCLISTSRMIKIFEELANIRNLRSLWLDGVQDRRISSRGTVHDALVSSLELKNTDLEVLKLPFGAMVCSIELWLDLNRAGRRLVCDETKRELPRSCWALVLERANRIPLSYVSPHLSSPPCRQGDDTSTEDYGSRMRRATIIFYFLRQKILVEGVA